MSRPHHHSFQGLEFMELSLSKVLHEKLVKKANEEGFEPNAFIMKLIREAVGEETPSASAVV